METAKLRVTVMRPTWRDRMRLWKEEHDLIMQKVGLHGQTPAGAIEFMLLTECLTWPTHHEQRSAPFFFLS